MAHLVYDSRTDFVGGGVVVLGHYLPEPVLAEHIAAVVLCFPYTIGPHKDNIAGLEPDRAALAEVRILSDADRQAASGTRDTLSSRINSLLRMVISRPR